MNRRIILLVVGLAASRAVAQPLATELRYQVRAYDPITNDGWASSMEAQPGMRVEVRAVVSYVGTGTVAALGQITFQPVISGGLSWEQPGGDNLLTNAELGLPGPPDGIGPSGGSRSSPPGTIEDRSGVYGRLTPWGANATTTSTFFRGHLGMGTASGLLRIGRSNITNWIGEGPTSGSSGNLHGDGGVNIAQIAAPSRTTTDPAFNNNTQNIVVFKFSVLISPVVQQHTLEIDTPPEAFGQVLQNGQFVPNTRWFLNETDATPAVQTSAEAVTGVIRVLPSPGAVSLLGLGVGISSGRRRRA